MLKSFVLLAQNGLVVDENDQRALGELYVVPKDVSHEFRRDPAPARLVSGHQ